MMVGARDPAHDYFDGENSTRGMLPDQKTIESKHGFWKCSVCTFDNDGSLSSCYICGVFQDSLNGLANKYEKQAFSIRENSISVMAKSLFAGMRHQRAVISTLSEAFLKKDTNSSETRSKASLDNLKEAFPTSISKHSITIGLIPCRRMILFHPEERNQKIIWPDQYLSAPYQVALMRRKRLNSVPNMKNQILHLLYHHI